jgi:hypothetical protein
VVFEHDNDCIERDDDDKFLTLPHGFTEEVLVPFMESVEDAENDTGFVLGGGGCHSAFLNQYPLF